MSRSTTVMCALLILGGVTAAIGQAWAVAGVFLLLGSAGLGSELRAARHRTTRIAHTDETRRQIDVDRAFAAGTAGHNQFQVY